MNRILSLLAALIILSVPIASVAKQPVKSYLGLWEGVDPNDGGHQIPSMTDNGDGTVRLLLHDTTYTLCPTDKGVSEGIGIIQQDGTLKSDDFTPPVRQTDYQYQLQRPFS